MFSKPFKLCVACWPLLVSLEMGISGQVSGQNLPPEPVDSFRRSLGSSGPSRLAEMRQALAMMKTSGEVGRALLLPEWQGQFREGSNKEGFESTVRRFVELSRTGLRSSEAMVRRQTARIIAEAGSVNSGAQSYTGAERSVSRDPFLRLSIATLQQELFGLAGSESVTQVEALYALGRIDSDPEKLAAATLACFKHAGAEGGKRRIAAADAVFQRAYSVSVLSRQGRYINPEESGGLRNNFLAVGRHLVPVAVTGLSDESRTVRLLCIDAVNAITDALAESDALIRQDSGVIDRDEGERANRLAALRKEQRDLEPLMKVLRNQIPEISRQGLRPGMTIHTRVDTLLILEDYAVIRARLSEQSASLGVGPGGNRLGLPKDLDPFPIDEKGVESVLESLIKGLRDEDGKVRLACAGAMELILLQPDVMEKLRDARESRLLAAILAMLKDEESPYVTLNLTRILSRVAPGQAESILPVAVGLLGHTDIDIRIQALAAIRNFGPKAEKAVPALALVVVEGDSSFRLAALQAIESVGLSAREAITPMARNLQHSDPLVRTAAARALGRFGALSKGVLPALEEASADSTPEVRIAASEAIVRIRTAARQ